MNYWLPALHVKISVAGQLCPWGDSKALISQVLEYIKFIKLHLYFSASNCNNTMSYQLFSDHHTCRIYLTFFWLWFALLKQSYLFNSILVYSRDIVKDFGFGLLGWLFTSPHTHYKWQANMIFCYLNSISMELGLMWNNLLYYYFQFIWHLSDTLDTSFCLKYLASTTMVVLKFQYFFFMSLIFTISVWNIPPYKQIEKVERD